MLYKVKTRLRKPFELMAAFRKTLDYPIFTYWSDENRTAIYEMITAWHTAFPRFKVLSDADILPMINEIQPDFIDTFRKIRIPAAKSDVARLLAIYRYGGLYVDCHMGIVDRHGIEALFARLTAVDHVFVDRRVTIVPRHPEEHSLINGMLMSRPYRSHLLEVVRQAMANLSWQRRMEMRDGFTKYSIDVLSGPRLLTAMTLQPGTCNREVRRDLVRRVLIIREEEFPVERNRYNSYRAPGTHWSERQTTELLFDC